MKVHRIELMVVDHDGLGIDEVVTVLENQKYPNWCIYPQVMATDTREIEWSDGHPLNSKDKAEAEFRRLFDRSQP
jgi:hypothetical protein